MERESLREATYKLFITLILAWLRDYRNYIEVRIFVKYVGPGLAVRVLFLNIYLLSLLARVILYTEFPALSRVTAIENYRIIIVTVKKCDYIL